jgi:hypothetical protein
VSVVLFGSYSVFLHCFRFCWLDFSFPLRGSVLPQVHSVPIGFSEASRRSFFPCCFSTHFLLARRQGFVAVPDFFFVRSTVAWGHFQQIGTSRSIAWYRLGFLPRNRSRVRFCFCPQLLSQGAIPSPVCGSRHSPPVGGAASLGALNPTRFSSWSAPCVPSTGLSVDWFCC